MCSSSSSTLGFSFSTTSPSFDIASVAFVVKEYVVFSPPLAVTVTSIVAFAGRVAMFPITPSIAIVHPGANDVAITFTCVARGAIKTSYAVVDAANLGDNVASSLTNPFDDASSSDCAASSKGRRASTLRKARVGAADIFARAFARDGEKRARKCGRGSASGCSSRADVTTDHDAGVKFMCLRFSSIASGASKPAPTSAVNLKEIHERVVFFRRLFLAKVERGEHEVRLTPRDDEALERLLLSQELVQREVLLVAQLLVANVKHGGDLIVLDVIDAEDELFLPRRVQARELFARVLVVLVLQHDFAARLFDAVELQIELLDVAAVDFDLQFIRSRAELLEFCAANENNRVSRVDRPSSSRTRIDLSTHPSSSSSSSSVGLPSPPIASSIAIGVRCRPSRALAHRARVVARVVVLFHVARTRHLFVVRARCDGGGAATTRGFVRAGGRE